MTKQWQWLLVGLLVAAAALFPLAPLTMAEESAEQAVVRLRIGVTADGIVRMTPADLQAAGVNVNSVDPRTFSMSSLGQPVAILVTGEADGRFDAGDQILFFGEKFRGPEMDQKYTDERVYWLEFGGVAGPRISSVNVAPTGSGSTPADVLTTLRAEENKEWWTLHSLGMDTEDTWFWGRIQTGPNPGDSAAMDFPFTVPDPAPGQPATLRLEQISRYNSSSTNFYHRTTIAVNGTSVGTFDWQGKRRIVHTATVPAGVLSGNTTTVRVAAVNRNEPPSRVTVSDDIYVNYWELDYRRLFRAWQGRFDFRSESAGTREYAVSNWTTNNVVVWDITTPTVPKQLTGAAVSTAGGGYQVRFRVTEAAGQRYWLQQADTFRAPASVRVRPATNLRAPAGGADAVIVTHSSLRPAADALAEWHRSQGRRALVVDVQDAYDEFNHGILHPKAIRAMLQWASSHWTPPAPKYLTLMGDGHWNFKGYNTQQYPNPPNLIPPYLAWADPWQGEVPADMLYGELTGDASPEVAVGRIPVNTLDEAWTVVNKIRTYDSGTRRADWQRRALFVSDNNDDTNFTALSDEIIGHLPSDITAQRVYLRVTHPDARAAKDAIRDAINAGVLLVQFNGHGATWRWAHEVMWSIDGVPNLINGDKLPVVMTFNCLDGYFAHPDAGQSSIAEVMLRRSGGGSILAISPSGLGAAPDQQNLRRILMDVIFREGVREMGMALTVAKQRFYAAYGADPRTHYLLYTQTLYGDPALRIPAAATGGSRVNLPLVNKGRR